VVQSEAICLSMKSIVRLFWLLEHLCLPRFVSILLFICKVLFVWSCGDSFLLFLTMLKSVEGQQRFRFVPAFGHSTLLVATTNSDFSEPCSCSRWCQRCKRSRLDPVTYRCPRVCLWFIFRIGGLRMWCLIEWLANTFHWWLKYDLRRHDWSVYLVATALLN